MSERTEKIKAIKCPECWNSTGRISESRGCY